MKSLLEGTNAPLADPEEEGENTSAILNIDINTHVPDPPAQDPT